MKDSDCNTVRAWEGGELDDTWPKEARRGTVMIVSDDKDAMAIVLDERGIRARFKVTRNKVPALIDAAARGWSRQKAGGSMAVVWHTGDDVSLGIVGPPNPPPPPDPPGQELLPVIAMQSHHHMVGLVEIASSVGLFRVR